MSEKDPAHARAAGKAAVAASIVWELIVGELRLRCLPKGERFELQVRHIDGTWGGVAYGPDPLEMLQRAARTGSVKRAAQFMVTK